MFDYLLSQLDSRLTWVQCAAYGAAWQGYDPDNMNAANSVKQILRIKLESNMTIGNDFCIEFWQEHRQSEYTLHHDCWDTVLWLINQLIKEIKP